MEGHLYFIFIYLISAGVRQFGPEVKGAARKKVPQGGSAVDPIADAIARYPQQVLLFQLIPYAARM